MRSWSSLFVLLWAAGCISPAPEGNNSTTDRDAANAVSADGGGEDAANALPNSTTNNTNNVVPNSDSNGNPNSATINGIWCFDAQLAVEQEGAVTITDVGAHGEFVHVAGGCPDGACWFVSDVSGGEWGSARRDLDERAESYVDLGCNSTTCYGATDLHIARSDGAGHFDEDDPTTNGVPLTAVAANQETIFAADSEGTVYWTDNGGWDETRLSAVNDFVSYSDQVLWAVGDSLWMAAQFSWTPNEDVDDVQSGPYRHGAATAENLYVVGDAFVHDTPGFTNVLRPNTPLGRIAAAESRSGDVVFVANQRRILYFARAMMASASTLKATTVEPEPSSDFAGIAFTASGDAWASTTSGEIYRFVAGETDCQGAGE